MSLRQQGDTIDRQLWAELSALISSVGRHFVDDPSFTFSTASIVRVFLFATLNDRPNYWACDPANWDRPRRPQVLPSQSTLSRRLRSPLFKGFMKMLCDRAARLPGAGTFFRRIDGKALVVPNHSTDRQATFGRGVGQRARGYKLHAIWSGKAMPDAFVVAPLGHDERVVARRLVRRLETPGGYVVGDKGYDANTLHAIARGVGVQLVAPRRDGPDKKLGHVRHDPGRLRSKDVTEPPTPHHGAFGRALLRERGRIERNFAHATSFGGGLGALPPWVRRPWRVIRHVTAKLLINAARLRLLERRKRAGSA